MTEQAQAVLVCGDNCRDRAWRSWWCDRAKEWCRKERAARAENERLSAALDAVRALAEVWKADHASARLSYDAPLFDRLIAAAALRAALPEETP